MKKDTHYNFIKHGSLLIEEFKVILLTGAINKVDEFLQGQVTSDHRKIINGGCQLSSICNHKGQVISDFFIIKSDNEYSFIIDKDLQDILIKELTPFAMLHRVNLQKIDSSKYFEPYYLHIDSLCKIVLTVYYFCDQRSII